MSPITLFQLRRKNVFHLSEFSAKSAENSNASHRNYENGFVWKHEKYVLLGKQNKVVGKSDAAVVRALGLPKMNVVPLALRTQTIDQRIGHFTVSVVLL